MLYRRIEALYREAEDEKLHVMPGAPLHSHFGGRAYAYREVLSMLKETGNGEADGVTEGEAERPEELRSL